jgi:multiple sugar transport system permease protein
MNNLSKTQALAAFSRKYGDRVKHDSRTLIGTGTVLALMTLVVVTFIAPFGFIATTSVKNVDQLALPESPVLPMTPRIFSYNGEALYIYRVPVDGVTRELALLQTRRSGSTFIDPDNPTAEPITVPMRAATLERVMDFDPHFDVYQQAVDRMDFSLALRNTLIVVLISTFGAVFSSALVAYGFSRFRIPGAGILFMILLATIILPPQVTLIPTFIVFTRIGWYPSLLPLIVPQFFANAYHVFLLRQFFLTIPVEMDEAARVDGANPLQTFFYIIIPQAKAAIITVTLFHFMYMWGEFYMASIFTGGSEQYATLSVSLQGFFQQYSNQPNQLMAGALLTMLPPVIIFLLAQRYFIQGIVITGVDK